MRADDQYISASSLCGLAEILGGDWPRAAAMVADAGVDPAALQRPDMVIPLRPYLMLLEQAAAETGRPDFGLEWAQVLEQVPIRWGTVLLIGYSSGSMREWIDRSRQYAALALSALTVEPAEAEATPGGVLTGVRISFDNFGIVPRQFAESTLALICGAVRMVGGADAGPALVRFQHSAPATIGRHRDVFGCPLEFGAGHSEILFRHAGLDEPVKANPHMFDRVLRACVRYRVDRLAQADAAYSDPALSGIVAQTIFALGGTGLVNTDVVAQSLGMTVKSLHRRLTAEDTGFAKILEQCRMDLARSHLRHSRASIGQIAGMLDYAGPAQFSSAFRRWTGLSPRDYRLQSED